MRLLAGVALAVLVAGVRTPAGQSRPGDDLPDGPGRKILQTACISCHELTEVTKFKGYYTRDDWRDVVVTMVKYGAVLKDKEPEVLVDYLTAALGKKDTR